MNATDPSDTECSGNPVGTVLALGLVLVPIAIAVITKLLTS
jgi:hypothetical protein